MSRPLNYSDISKGIGHLHRTGATKRQILETVNRETRGVPIKERRQIIRDMLNNK